jgi:hypothetical protein
MSDDISEKINKSLNLLDVINDSFLPEKEDGYEEVGIIEDEKTKKLFYYVLVVIGKKIINLLDKVEDLESRYEMGEGVSVEEQIMPIDNELKELEKRKDIATKMLFSALARYIKPGNKCPVYSVKRGWKVVRPKNCDACPISGLFCDKSYQKIFSNSKKYRNNYMYN